MPTWIVEMVVNFLLRQVKKWGEQLDWAKVKADAEARIRAVLPDWVEGAAVDVALGALEVCKYVLGDAADLKRIVDLLQAGDVAGAFGALVALIEEALRKPAPVHVTDFAAKANKALAAAKALQRAA